MQEIRSLLQSLHDKLSNSLSKIPRLLKALNLSTSETLDEYFEIISHDTECIEWQSKIRDELTKNEEEMKKYLEQWKQYEHLWQSDKQITIDAFENSENALAVNFDKNIRELFALSNEVNVRETSTQVHFMLVNAKQLQRTILIEINDWKQLYLVSLKQKVSERIEEFFNYTNANGEKVSVVPKSVEELQICCSVYEQLKEEIDHYKCNIIEINDEFDVLSKYKISIDGELKKMRLNMQSQWNKYLKKLSDSEEILNNAKESFKMTLESDRKTPDFF